MRISKKAEYALRALILMARQTRSWSILELSRQENIPIKFLEQILLILRRAGLLASKRGVGGGYVLLRPAAGISLGEILEVMDGPLAPVACAAALPLDRCTCPEPRTCALRLAMNEVREKMQAQFAAVTLEDLVHRSAHGQALAFEI